jgi:hypothetical protein
VGEGYRRRAMEGGVSCQIGIILVRQTGRLTTIGQLSVQEEVKGDIEKHKRKSQRSRTPEGQKTRIVVGHG